MGKTVAGGKKKGQARHCLGCMRHGMGAADVGELPRVLLLLYPGECKEATFLTLRLHMAGRRQRVPSSPRSGSFSTESFR